MLLSKPHCELAGATVHVLVGAHRRVQAAVECPANQVPLGRHRGDVHRDGVAHERWQGPLARLQNLRQIYDCSLVECGEAGVKGYIYQGNVDDPAYKSCGFSLS